MWVARDKDNTLKLFTDMPELDLGKYWISDSKGYVLPSEIFPKLTFEDEPIEVEIVCKRFMDMWRAKNNVMLQMFEDDLCKEENDCNNCLHATDITDKDCFCKSFKSYVHFPQKDCGRFLRKEPLEPITDEDIWNIM